MLTFEIIHAILAKKPRHPQPRAMYMHALNEVASDSFEQ